MRLRPGGGMVLTFHLHNRQPDCSAETINVETEWTTVWDSCIRERLLRGTAGMSLTVANTQGSSTPGQTSSSETLGSLWGLTNFEVSKSVAVFSTPFSECFLGSGMLGLVLYFQNWT